MWYEQDADAMAPSKKHFISTDIGPMSVDVADVDCDLAKGTFEALQGVARALAPDGVVFSQDIHIARVRRLLPDPSTWRRLGLSFPQITFHGTFLASLRFNRS